MSLIACDRFDGCQGEKVPDHGCKVEKIQKQFHKMAVSVYAKLEVLTNTGGGADWLVGAKNPSYLEEFCDF